MKPKIKQKLVFLSSVVLLVQIPFGSLPAIAMENSSALTIPTPTNGQLNNEGAFGTTPVVNMETTSPNSANIEVSQDVRTILQPLLIAQTTSGDSSIISTINNVGTQGITVDSLGNIFYVKTSKGSKIYKLSTDGVESEFASLGSTTYQLVIDANDNIYAAANSGLKKIDPQGNVTSIPGPTNVTSMALAIDNSGNVYYSDNLTMLKKVDPMGNVTVLASGFNQNMGMALDSNGNVYVADYMAHVIKKVDTSNNNNVTVIAGTVSSSGYTGNGGLAIDAKLKGPHNMIISDGQLYVAEYDNYVVRKIDLATGIIDVVAGNGTSGNTGDGGAADAATLGRVFSISKDAYGILYIAAENATKMVYTPGTMSGTIIDSIGNPVVGASVAIAGTTTSTTTNASGSFTLNNVIPGNKKLSVSAVGYENGESTVAVNNGQIVSVGNIILGMQVSGVTLDKSSLALELGGAPITLNATVSPSNATDKNVTWHSSDTNVATVDNNGLVTSVALGTTIITVTTVDGSKTATSSVTVRNPLPAAPNVTANDAVNVIEGLDTTMEFQVDGGSYVKYDGTNAPNLSGNHTVLVRIAENAATGTPAGTTKTLTFTTNPPATGGGGNPVTPPVSNSGEGGGSTTVEPIPTPQSMTQQILVNVDGNDGQNLVEILISRTTESSGTVKDKVNLPYSIVTELVKKAKEQGVDTASIFIPDKEDIVSEIQVEIPKVALEELNRANLNLEITTPNAIISIPIISIDNFNQDLYFQIIPIKSEIEKKQIENRAKNESLIQETVGNNTVQVLGRPMKIETNMQGRQVSLVLPITASLPTNPAERQKVLNNLGVFIEHSDGTKELIKGTVVKMKDGSEGLEFKVNKFSTFTIVYLEGWQGEVAEKVTHTPYIKGYSNNEFRPNALVTRAQMAKMLARNLEVPLATTVYADVKPSHGAFNDVMEVKAAGIMTGVNPTTFNLNGNVTRAQMATIVYRWIQKQCEKGELDTAICAKLSDTSGSSFKDVTSKHGAAEAIRFTKEAGIMEGFEDNTFKPNQALTRAQAVKVINILFKRGPLLNVVTPTFKDVPKTHWAFGEVEEAAREHEIILDANR